MSSARTIEIFGKLTTEESVRICAAIRDLTPRSNEPITLLINCPGGVDWENVVEEISATECPIHGHVIQEASSAGFNILQSCHKRIADYKAQLMFHPPRYSAEYASWITGFPAEDDIVLENDLAYRRMLTSLARRSGQQIEFLEKSAREETIFSAETALRFGFIDEIADLRK